VKRAWIVVLACIVLLGGLVGFLFWNQARSSRTAEDAVYDQAAKNLALQAQQEVAAVRDAAAASKQRNITRLVLTREGETLSFASDADGLWVLEGEETPLLQEAVSEIAALATITTGKTISEDSVLLADYGLDSPAATLTATLRDGTTTTISLGAETSDGNSVYAMSTASIVYLLSIEASTKLHQSIEQFIDKTLPVVTTENLLSISLQPQGQALIAAERDTLPAPSGDFVQDMLFTLQMTSPLAGRDVYMITLSTAILEPLSSVSLGALAGKATAENLAAYGLLSPALDMTLTGEGYRYHLTIGNPVGLDASLYAVYEGIPYIFEVSAESIQPLLDVTDMSLMDRFISLVPIDQVATIGIDDYVNRLVHYCMLNRPSDANGTPADIAPTVNGQAVQPSAFRQFYESIAGIVFDDILNGYEPTGDPALIITYTRADGLPPIVDTYYEYDEQFFAIKKDGEGVFLVSRAQLDTIHSTANDLLRGRLNTYQ